VGPDALNVPGDGSFRTFVRNLGQEAIAVIVCT